MSSTSGAPNASTSTPPDPTLVASMIARLRAEHDATDSGTTRALLLHEVGVLEELIGDEATAAHDLLGAVNAEPEFREPLERLISIIERRQSYKNLGKLLERLVKVAEESDERCRALQEQAAFVADHEADPEAACRLLEEAVEQKPDDAAAWLALEIMAGRLDDVELRTRALAARCELTHHATWRALMLMDLADLQLEQGEVEAALEALDNASGAECEATYLVHRAVEALGLRQERDDLTAAALEAQAELIQTAMADGERGDALGVPRYRRSAVCAAETLLRAALARRSKGELEAATELLDRALALLPGAPALLHARLGAADAMGDTAAAAAHSRAKLDQGVKGSLAAALWLRISESAAAEGDGAGALEAVGKALEQDAKSIPARALQLDLLAGEHDPQALAAALESTAEHLETEEAKARFYLSSADVFARVGRDPQGAKAALSQAGMYGATPNVVARVARMLATGLDDAAWFEEATRRLLAAGASDDEQCSLWFELGRARLLRGDAVGAGQAFASLANATGGAWLGHALRAYALPFGKPADDPAATSLAHADAMLALQDLARVETDPQTARSLRTVVARRALLAGKVEEATKELGELHGDDPADPVAANALACVLRVTDQPQRAAEVLGACALASSDSQLGAALYLEAGILYWTAGDRSAAIDCFNSAAGATPAAGAAVLGWALRAADPDDLVSRRRAVDAAAESAEPGLSEIERFGLEMGPEGDRAEARFALDSIDPAAPPEIAQAATLARALWAPDPESAEPQLQALDELAVLSPEAAAMAASAAFQARLREEGEANLLEEVASQWTDADPQIAAAIEWLAAAIAAGDLPRESEARECLARRLPEEMASPIESTARILGALTSEDPQPLTAGGDAAAQLTNLELAPPGSDPRRRTAALIGADGLFGEEGSAMLQAMAGWNYLVNEDWAGATNCFRRVVQAHPDEIVGWEGLRTVGEASGDRALVAEACAALGDAVSDDVVGAELWEQSALILIDELDDRKRGEIALSRAVQRDISRFVAFDRLFRIVRARKNHERLLDLISRRLEVADDSEEIAKLFWERARVLRKLDKREEALAALENVTMLEPDHVGALALSGEIYITSGQFAEAAQNLARLATLDEAPRQQRLMSGVAAVDLYENKLGQPETALEVLSQVYRSELSTMPVRERLARLAAKLGAWDQAVEVLEELMVDRETSEGRIEAARLAIAIHRDSRDRPGDSEAAVVQLLHEAPDDGEALDIVLSGVLPDSTTEQLLVAGQASLVSGLMEDPLQPEGVDRLARMAAFLGNTPLRQAALGALVSLGQGTPEVDQELLVLDERVAHVPQIAIDDSSLPDLCDPADSGPIPVLMRAVASTIADALGPGLAALGVTKKERVDPRAGLPVRNEIAAWAGALGLGDFDLYVGGPDPNGVVAVATERPALVIGRAVAAPLSPAHRQAVARELFALKRGSSVLRHRDLTDIAALVVATCRIGGHELPSPQYAMLGEFQRALQREMPRRVKKMLPELALHVVQEQQDPLVWAQGATASLDRLAAVAAGDVSYVLASDAAGRGHVGASDEARRRAARLLSFVLSPTYLAVREQLGMGVR